MPRFYGVGCAAHRSLNTHGLHRRSHHSVTAAPRTAEDSPADEGDLSFNNDESSNGILQLPSLVSHALTHQCVQLRHLSTSQKAAWGHAQPHRKPIMAATRQRARSALRPTTVRWRYSRLFAFWAERLFRCDRLSLSFFFFFASPGNCPYCNQKMNNKRRALTSPAAKEAAAIACKPRLTSKTQVPIASVVRLFSFARKDLRMVYHAGPT